MEAAAAAFGKVYCFGPTFRAEKSKTRRHLAEFWMVEPEVAFMDLEGDMRLAEDFIAFVVGARARDAPRGARRSLRAGHDARSRRVKAPFPRITYAEAIEHPPEERPPRGEVRRRLRRRRGDGHLAEVRPAGHRPPLPDRSSRRSTSSATRTTPSSRSNMDVLAPEGYGEIIGGGQREDEARDARRGDR